MRTDLTDFIMRAFLHRFWSQATGTTGYDKEDWKALDRMLFGPYSWGCNIYGLIGKLREYASSRPTYGAEHWDLFERLIFGHVLREPKP